MQMERHGTFQCVLLVDAPAYFTYVKYCQCSVKKTNETLKGKNREFPFYTIKKIKTEFKGSQCFICVRYFNCSLIHDFPGFYTVSLNFTKLHYFRLWDGGSEQTLSKTGHSLFVFFPWGLLIYMYLNLRCCSREI